MRMGYPMCLNEFIPWGRSFDEYTRMFDLRPEDLQRRILGCADGPASFNAELTQMNKRAVSIDPLYAFTAENIERRIDAVYDSMLDAARRKRNLRAPLYRVFLPWPP